VALVPRTAVRTANGTSVVFIVRGDVVERRGVDVGGSDGDRVEIRAGLSVGERVVLSPPADLVDGARVTVK
jgi:multidrug efflux pump subunit AcrA (membrane-fusion protein)